MNLKGLKGKVIVNGKVVNNLAMDIYRKQLTTWLAGGAPLTPQYIALGQGTINPTVGDTVLGSELLRKQVNTRFQRNDDTARLTTIFNVDEPPTPFGSANVPIREVGLFDTGVITIANDGFETWTIGSPNSWFPPVNSGTIAGTVTQESGSVSIYEKSYSALLSRYVGTPSFNQSLTWDPEYQGKQFTVRSAVKAGSANLARIFIDDGVTTTYSSYHSGTARFELLSAQKTLSGTANRLMVGGEVQWGGTAGTIGSAWFDWFRCTQNGNMWARALFSLDKEPDEPLAVIWELYFERQNEEGVMPFTAYDTETFLPGTISAGSLSPSKYNPVGQGVAQEVFITNESNGGTTNSLRYYVHGGTPGTATGHILTSSNNITLAGSNNIANFRFVAAQPGTPSIVASYFR